MIAPCKPEHLTRRIIVPNRRRGNSDSNRRWLHCFASEIFPRYTITIAPKYWFSGAFRVSFAIFKPFLHFIVHFVHINQIPTATTCGCWQSRSTKSCVCHFVCFHSLSKELKDFSNISDGRCGHRRRSCWYFNYRKCRWSPKIMKTGVSPWRALKTPWKFFGNVWHKFGWSLLGNRSISQEGS